MKKKTLVIVFGIVIAMLLAVIALLLVKANKKDSEVPVTVASSSKPREIVTQSNAESIIAQMQEEATKPQRAMSYTITMAKTKWNFENGTSASPDSYVANDASNDCDVYFDITRDDNGETIYESPIIPLGGELESVTLDKVLNAGTYSCTMTYSLLDDDHLTVLSTVNVALTINIKN